MSCSVLIICISLLTAQGQGQPSGKGFQNSSNKSTNKDRDGHDQLQRYFETFIFGTFLPIVLGIFILIYHLCCL